MCERDGVFNPSLSPLSVPQALITLSPGKNTTTTLSVRPRGLCSQREVYFFFFFFSAPTVEAERSGYRPAGERGSGYRPAGESAEGSWVQASWGEGYGPSTPTWDMDA